MKRKRLNVIYYGLLFLTFVTILFWIKSYWYRDIFGVRQYNASALTYHGFGIEILNGNIEFEASTTDFSSMGIYSVIPRRTGLVYESDDASSGWRITTPFPSIFGALLPMPDGMRTRGRGGDYSLSGFILPLWILFFVELFILWRLQLWRKTGPKGLCSTCGYDLRASKDRCPECGTLFASQTLFKG